MDGLPKHTIENAYYPENNHIIHLELGWNKRFIELKINGCYHGRFIGNNRSNITNNFAKENVIQIMQHWL